MSATETRQAIESILMVADNPVDPSVLAQLLEVPRADVEAMCAELAAEYQESGRGFILARVAGGYRFQSHPDLAPYVERFVLDGQTSRLSSAALETLAIVAYKQPISRMQIAAIRGVNVDGVLRTLQQRGYVDEVSRDTGPGNAVLFGTTDLFLERVGLDSTDDLPPLAEFVPGADVVEALEEGLRPDPIETTAPPADEAPSESAPTDEAGVDADAGSEAEPAAQSDVPADPADVVVVEEAIVVEGHRPAADQVTEVDPTRVEGGVEAIDEDGDETEGDIDLEPGIADADADISAGAGASAGADADADADADIGAGADADVDADIGAGADADVGAPSRSPSADDVIDLVAEEAAVTTTPTMDEVAERPTALGEELAAMDALAADMGGADDVPTWSPAESSAVTTVRHDDPPEPATAAPFRPAPGHPGGTGIEAASHGQGLAAGEDLGAGEAAPLTGPDTGDH